jgi:hypothetical protein
MITFDSFGRSSMDVTITTAFSSVKKFFVAINSHSFTVVIKELIVLKGKQHPN